MLKSREDRELAYRIIELFLVQPVEFLSLSPSSPPQQQIPPPSPPQQTSEQKISTTKTPALANILYLLPIPLLAILLVFVLIRSKEKGKRR
jgi:hypothetical protein